jgi:hypothetical protein
LGLVNQVYWEVPVQNKELRISLVPTVKKISEAVGMLFQNCEYKPFGTTLGTNPAIR